MTLDNYIYKIKKNISPFRTAIFTVFISVVASICVSVVSEIGKQIMTAEMDSIGLNGLAAVAYNTDGENITDTKFYGSVDEIDDVNNSSPIITENCYINFTNGCSISAMCWGVSPDVSKIISLETVAGRMINKTDIESNARVCLIDENVAYTAYKRNNICDKKILININDTVVEFTVIGTIKKSSNVLNSLTGDVIPDFVYIPYSTMMDISSKATFDQVIFTSENTEQTNEEFKNKLSQVNFRYKNQLVNLTNLSEQKEQITKITDTAFLSLFLVSCVAIVVCSMSVGASVNTAVISRQKDIGIKMSMGAGIFDIISEFMFYSLSACLIGIFSAVTTMFLVLKTVSFIIPWHMAADIKLIASSIFVTIILTTIFSFLPSYKAAKMAPIIALNRE